MNRPPYKLSKQQIERICKLYKNNKLNVTKTARKYGVARRSIYYHLWKRGLAQKKRNPSFITKLLNRIKHKKLSILTPSSAYILGSIIGDGHIGKGVIIFKVRDKDFALNFKKKLEEWTKKRAKLKGIYLRKYKKYDWHIIYYSIELQKIISFYKENINQIMLNAPKECQIAFLEGLYDAEGHVSLKNKYINFCNTNKELIYLVSSLLKKLRIEHKINQYSHKDSKFKKFYYLNIYKNTSKDLFHKIIFFSIKRKQAELNKLVSL